MSRIEYPAKAVVQARELFAAGWDLNDVRKIIGHEFGMTPTRETVRYWVDDKWAAQRRNAFSRSKRKARRAEGVTWLYQGATADTKAHRMTVLREAGLSYNAIAAVMWLDYGVRLSRDQVQGFVLTGSVPRPLREAA